mmetsp:Transcript_19065/g.50124  ORF Transcript_19065/g.50124 Transcript_19065/m.50124 type:complete len:221 (+) Transcript_19065:488-1150(+)
MLGRRCLLRSDDRGRGHRGSLESCRGECEIWTWIRQPANPPRTVLPDSFAPHTHIPPTNASPPERHDGAAKRARVEHGLTLLLRAVPRRVRRLGGHVPQLQSRHVPLRTQMLRWDGLTLLRWLPRGHGTRVDVLSAALRERGVWVRGSAHWHRDSPGWDLSHHRRQAAEASSASRTVHCRGVGRRACGGDRYEHGVQRGVPHQPGARLWSTRVLLDGRLG